MKSPNGFQASSILQQPHQEPEAAFEGELPPVRPGGLGLTGGSLYPLRMRLELEGLVPCRLKSFFFELHLEFQKMPYTQNGSEQDRCRGGGTGSDLLGGSDAPHPAP